MLFFYGRSKEHVLGHQHIREANCPSCRQPGGMGVAFCYRYAHLYWVPILGWKKTFAYCAGCNQRFEQEKYSQQFREVVAAEWKARRYRVPVYAYAWLIIIVSCFLLYKIINR